MKLNRKIARIRYKRGHSIIELLVVLGIMGLLASLAVCGANLFTANRFKSDVYQFKEIMEQAKAYAIANNTYVFVGMEEVDGSQTPGANPQVVGTGRVAIAVVASNNGTALYNSNSWQSSNPTNLSVVIPATVLDGMHMVDFSNMDPSSGGMYRPAVSSQYSIANSGCPSTSYTFGWPLSSSSPKFLFQKLIQFGPDGQSTLVPPIYSLSTSAIVTTLEMGFLPSYGNQSAQMPANISIGDQSAIQIDGVSGVTQIYQP